MKIMIEIPEELINKPFNRETIEVTLITNGKTITDVNVEGEKVEHTLIESEDK